MVLKPGAKMAEAIFHKWELDFAVIGEVTETGHMVLNGMARPCADIPLGPLAEDAPLYDRPHLSRADYKAWAKVAPLRRRAGKRRSRRRPSEADGSPDIASRRWIWEQYDNKVGADTVQPPGGDAAVVRIHGTHKALAISRPIAPRAIAMPIPMRAESRLWPNAYRNLERSWRDAACHHQLPELC
jgi:phosphoribosylformylglycinamidine (FGAM) synthase-like enzyme